MIWLIIGGVISLALIIIAIIVGFNEVNKITERLGNSFWCAAFAVLLSMLIMAFSLIIAMICGAMLHTQVETVKNVSASQEIVALKDNNNVSGGFYLGTGCARETSYYYYMVKGDNGLDMKKIKTDECSLQFDENPRIETITYQFKNPKYNWIGMNNFTEHIIYCPEGTVDYSFQVDLQ